MKGISIDNGANYFFSAEDLEARREEIIALWEAIVLLMEDRARELAHKNCPEGADEVVFLEIYLQHADDDLVVG